MSPDDLPDRPEKPAPSVPDPTRTTPGADRRGEILDYPALMDALDESKPVPTAPPASPRRWDGDSGSWIDDQEPLPSDPGLASVDSQVPESDPSASFDFPSSVSDLPITDSPDISDEATPDAWLDRIRAWLGLI